MATELQKHVASITHAMLQIRDMFADPSAVRFHEVHEEMERLEAALHVKAFIDASFAFMAERDGAGRLVGAKYPNAYFKEHVLVDQPFAKDPKQSVAQVLEAAGVAAKAFARFRVGS